MSALIERDFEFQAGLYFQNKFLLNLYEFQLIMEVNTDSIEDQNIALERIKYFIYEVLENCIFVNETDSEIIQKYRNANLKLCTLPDDPYDQIVSLLILLKLNCICEGKLKVLDITFTSKLSDGVKFKENILTAQHAYSKKNWYSQNDTSIMGEFTKTKKDKIVKLRNDDWKELGLYWSDYKSNSKEIIFNLDTDK